jgi:hypothetical protein
MIQQVAWTSLEWLRPSNQTEQTRIRVLFSSGYFLTINSLLIARYFKFKAPSPQAGDGRN